MHILFCGDKGVCDGIFLSALSLCKYNRQPLHIVLLTASAEKRDAIPQSFADDLREALRERNKDSTVTLRDITEKFYACLPLANMQTRFTPLCMLRLFADGIPEIPDKILYLDADVLCCADCSTLYDTDMTDFEIAGVPDRYGKWFFGNVLRHDYLNSGVLLLNMQAIRQSGLFAKCRILCRDKRMFMPDQSALNKLAVKKKLPAKYNEQGKPKTNTVLKHFTTFFKFFPFLHAVTVKPWETEKLHTELKIYQFDSIIQDYQRRKENATRDPHIFHD